MAVVQRLRRLVDRLLRDGFRFGVDGGLEVDAASGEEGSVRSAGELVLESLPSGADGGVFAGLAPRAPLRRLHVVVATLNFGVLCGVRVDGRLRRLLAEREDQDDDEQDRGRGGAAEDQELLPRRGGFLAGGPGGLVRGRLRDAVERREKLVVGFEALV